MVVAKLDFLALVYTDRPMDRTTASPQSGTMPKHLGGAEPERSPEARSWGSAMWMTDDMVMARTETINAALWRPLRARSLWNIVVEYEIDRRMRDVVVDVHEGATKSWYNHTSGGNHWSIGMRVMTVGLFKVKYMQTYANYGCTSIIKHNLRASTIWRFLCGGELPRLREQAVLVDISDKTDRAQNVIDEMRQVIRNEMEVVLTARDSGMMKHVVVDASTTPPTFE